MAARHSMRSRELPGWMVRCHQVLLRDAAQRSMVKCLKCDADTDSECEQCGDPVCNDCGTIESITDDERGETYETMYCEDCAGG